MDNFLHSIEHLMIPMDEETEYIPCYLKRKKRI
jgi:hypothetical protein